MEIDEQFKEYSLFNVETVTNMAVWARDVREAKNIADENLVEHIKAYNCDYYPRRVDFECELPSILIDENPFNANSARGKENMYLTCREILAKLEEMKEAKRTEAIKDKQQLKLQL